MTTTTPTRPSAVVSPVGAAVPPPASEAQSSSAAVVLLAAGLTAAIAALAAVHVAQGTGAVGVGDVVDWILGRTDVQTAAIITDSRLPRVAAAGLVGVALGASGAVMQSFARNVLASPDTLAVNNGAYLALTAAAVTGVQLPVFGSLGIAFAGGLVGALLVLLLAGTGYGTVRLILAGIAMALMFDAASTALTIIFPYEARGLFAWSSGSLGQTGYDGVLAMTPVVLLALLPALLLGRRLDLLALGDDAATSLGVPVRRTQVQMLGVSVLLATAAVTLVGPIGYVGLIAPTLVRLLAARVPGLHRHRSLLPVSALACVLLLLAADVTIRALVGADEAIDVPTGVTTSLIGAGVLAAMALRLRAGTLEDVNALGVRGTGVRHPRVLLAVLALLVAGTVVAGFLIGDRTLLVGDLVVWLQQQAGPVVSGVMSTRPARVLAALLAGVALGVAGTVIQGVTRNPLADPTVLGISGGGAVLGVVVVTWLPLASFWVLAGAAFVGCLISAAAVFGLTARSGFATDRLVLVGVAVSVGCSAVVTVVIVSTDPWNQAKALTWLSGSTYGRSMEHLLPLGLGCAVALPLLLAAHRSLDLLSVDNDVPVLLGLSPRRSRGVLLLGAVLLVSVAVAAIGVVGFVGLLAPHAARSLVGRRHRYVLPVAALVGGGLVVCGDLVGRSLLAPIQLPASLLTAFLGAPYFFWLMVRARRRRA